MNDITHIIMDAKTANIPFSKQQLLAEFSAFSEGLQGAIAALFGNTTPGTPSDTPATQTYLWACLDVMYDYGVLGKSRDSIFDLGVHGVAPDSTAADALGFFVVARPGLQNYLMEQDTPWPELCTRTVVTATARHILDGGDRGWENERMPVRSLNLEEIALLANMDAGSVRNATVATKTGAAKLNTFKRGPYTFVDPDEARAWLASRPGFIPTSKDDTRSGFDYLKQDFAGLSHLVHFLVSRATRSLLSTKKLSAAAGVPLKTMEAWLVQPSTTVKDGFLLGLARALDLDVPMFELRLGIARQTELLEQLRHAAQQRYAALQSPPAAS